jgi:uncharacterized metal-binding protein YceD (DUF177 family)
MKHDVEFSRPIEVSRISPRGSHERLKADPKECQAIAKRMNLQAVHALTAELVAKPWRAGGVKVKGSLTVDAEQISVISLEPFRSSLTYVVESYFLPAGSDPDDEADHIEDGIIDLGEVVSETLALSLEPYPRRADEEFAGFDSEEQRKTAVSPFAKLSDKIKNPK